MSIVLVLFVAANVSYFMVLDPATIASTNTVALDYGRVTLGRVGGVVFGTLVAISSFGALNASFFTSERGRVPYKLNGRLTNPSLIPSQPLD